MPHDYDGQEQDAGQFLLYDPDTGEVMALMDSPLQQDHGLWLAIDAKTAAAMHDLSDWRVVDGQPRLVSLDGARTSAIERVNNIIGQMRAVGTTAIAGQEVVYAAKETEAAQFLADPMQLLEPFPFLAAEVAATGAEPRDLARTYLEQAASHRARLAALEGIRLGAIAAVRAAATSDEIAAAVQAFEVSLSPPTEQAVNLERTAPP